MKKIKKFKINLRAREVTRLLKATAEITEITPQLEEAIQRETLNVQKSVSPAAIYETFFKEKYPEGLLVSPPDVWVAGSIYLVTLGEEIELLKDEALSRGENLLSQIIHSAGLEALEQSAGFVQRLMAEESKEENCELSDRKRVNTPEFYKTLFASLPGDKIGVQILENNLLKPLYSSGGIIYWIQQKKRGGKGG
ncbi:MAG: hypothetical protein ABII64_09020 [Elusimicrobiota bacterium]